MSLWLRWLAWRDNLCYRHHTEKQGFCGDLICTACLVEYKRKRESQRSETRKRLEADNAR